MVRGVPLDASGYFFEPLWTNFTLGETAGILDWYTISIGSPPTSRSRMHGALWVAYKCEGAIADRSRRIARLGGAGLLLMTAVVTAVSMRIQPQILINLEGHPWGFVFPVLAIAGLAGILSYPRGHSTPERDRRAFYASCAYLLGMLTSVAFGLYPYVLPARSRTALSLSIYNARTSDRALAIGLAWWIVGMILAAVYFLFLYRRFSGKVHTGESHGYD